MTVTGNYDGPIHVACTCHHDCFSGSNVARMRLELKFKPGSNSKFQIEFRSSSSWPSSIRALLGTSFPLIKLRDAFPLVADGFSNENYVLMDPLINIRPASWLRGITSVLGS